jgi:hypothetical protein
MRKMPTTIATSPRPVKNTVEMMTRPMMAIGMVRMRNPNSRGTVAHREP